jgi:hypothetical protein
MSAASAAMPLGLLVGGVLGEWIDNDITLIFMGAGICIALTTLIAGLNSNLKSYLAGQSDTSAPQLAESM